MQNPPRLTLELVVATNVKAVLDHMKLSVPQAAAKCGMKPEQMRRIVSARHSITLDTLARLAKGTGLEPYQLLVPGLNPGNPQILRSLSPKEDALYRALEDARRDGEQ